jgi:hypothetical protein
MEIEWDATRASTGKPIWFSSKVGLTQKGPSAKKMFS